MCRKQKQPKVSLQLTFVRDQANNPRAAFFLGSALVFPSPASVALSPTPDNEERGPVVKSYLKQSSELRRCANSSSVTQRVIGVLLPATRTNASNNCAASNAPRLSSGALPRRFCAHSVALISRSNAGNTQPFVSPQKQTALLFSQRTEAKNELMSHRSEDLPLKENTALILITQPRFERDVAPYPSGKSSRLLRLNLMLAGDLCTLVSLKEQHCKRAASATHAHKQKGHFY